MREGKAVKARNCSAGCVLGHERLTSELHHLDWASAQKPTKVELADSVVALRKTPAAKFLFVRQAFVITLKYILTKHDMRKTA
jgi:hypothetical protein